MTAPEILRIAVTVGTVQLICDLLANWTIYSKEPYQRAVEKLQRCKFKLDQIVAKEQQGISSGSTTTKTTAKESTIATSASSSSKKNSKADRNAKKLQRAQDDHADALANVARRHTVPGVLTSILFLIVMRVLGTELRGQIIALLPFSPFRLLKRMTARNLEFPSSSDIIIEAAGASGGAEAAKVNDIAQACSFTFIYMLTAASVKYYVHQFVGTKPPAGAESIMSIVESPQGQKIIRSVGLEPVDLKAE